MWKNSLALISVGEDPNPDSATARICIECLAIASYKLEGAYREL